MTVTKATQAYSALMHEYFCGTARGKDVDKQLMDKCHELEQGIACISDHSTDSEHLERMRTSVQKLRELISP